MIICLDWFHCHDWLCFPRPCPQIMEWKLDDSVKHQPMYFCYTVSLSSTKPAVWSLIGDQTKERIHWSLALLAFATVKTRRGGSETLWPADTVISVLRDRDGQYLLCPDMRSTTATAAANGPSFLPSWTDPPATSPLAAWETVPYLPCHSQASHVGVKRQQYNCFKSGVYIT